MAEANTKEAILSATEELLQKIVEANDVDKEEVACVFFTTTSDINAEFPAAAARNQGWTQVPLMCAKEIDVPGSMAMCIRILLLHNTEKRPGEINHVYLRGTDSLRQQESNR